MENNLFFDSKRYCVEELHAGTENIRYRAFRNITYVKRPVDEIQKLNIFVPEKYFAGEEINGYGLRTAPIFLPNTVGGYKPGPAGEPCVNKEGQPNAMYLALQHGYVVVSAGVRGRGSVDAEGRYIGAAPAVVCDMKAAVRFLRYFDKTIPGDKEKIITNGTSAGGALSALMGATGNHPDYEPYLKEMGAADTADHVFGASCYCPITNLEHADMAYEWEFGGIREYCKWNEQGKMSDKQISLSEILAGAFPLYVNSLHLKDEEGQELSLSENGEGTFQKKVEEFVIASACREVKKGTDLSQLSWITWQDGKICGIDFKEYVRFRTRMKTTPAFDNITMGTAENELFGDLDIRERHFTSFGYEHSEVMGELAEEQRIKMMNPMNYLKDDLAVKAKHYRIRHGAVDRDTSLAIPVILHTKLMNAGIDSDLEFPWGIPHAGDYDLNELFRWIDAIVTDNV